MRRRRAPRSLVVLAALVSLISTGLSAALPKETAAGPRNPKAPIPLPDISETANTVLNEDGTYTASLYTGRVNYRDDKREFKDIGKDLVPSEVPGYAWSNGANQFNAEFKAVLGKDFLRLDTGANSFSFSLEGSLPVPGAALGAEVTYPAALPHVNLSYHALPDEVRKYLTLLDPLAQSSFRFILTPPEGAKVVPEERKDGSWAFRVAPQASPAFVLEAPWAIDSSGKSQDNPEGENPDGHPHATMAVTEVQGGFAVDLAIDEPWLKAPERVFPVTLDPTIGLQPSVQDASFGSSCPNCRGVSLDHLRIGSTSASAWRGAVQFDLSAIPPGAVVSSASLKLYFDKTCLAGGGAGLCGGVAHQIDSHRMTGPWDVMSSWNSLSFEPDNFAFYTLPVNPTFQWMSWNATARVQAWIAGTEPNHGVLLKRNTEPLNISGPMPVARAYSGEPALRPVLEVTYTANAVFLYPPEILRSNGASLRWSTYYSPTGDPFISYEVHRSATPGFTPSETTLLATITDIDETSFTDTSAKASTGFSYKIKTGSSVSNERTVTLPADGTASMTLQPEAETGTAGGLHYYSGYTACDNAGAQPRLTAGTTAADKYRPVLYFDLRDIPVGATVSSATLSLWNDTPPSWAPTVEVHRMTAEWEEGTGVGLSTCTGDGATWYETESGIDWSSEGGEFDPAVEASVSKAANGPPVWDSFTITSLVQKWVNTEEPNLGVLIKVSDETLVAGRTFSYASDDYSEAIALRPKLTLAWAEPTEVIKPTVSISEPPPGEQVTGGSVTVTAAVSDDRRVDSVQFLLDDNPIGGPDTTPPFSITWNSTGASNGSHTLKAVATDDAGNVMTSSGSSTTVNNHAAPTTAITSPPSGQTVTGTTTVTASASVAPGLTVTRVEFYVDGVQFAEDTDGSPYSVNWNTLDPAVPSYDGAHALTSVVYDSSGQDATSADLPVTVDNRQTTKYKATLATAADAIPPTVAYTPGLPVQLVYPIDVTITNNSSVTWSATDISLRYRWYNPQAPGLAITSDPNVTDGGQNPLGQILGPGGQLTKRLNVSPPVLLDGISRSTYRLQVDLYEISTSTWFAAQGNQPRESSIIINKKDAADALGLERYHHYVGADLGAGMQQMTNVATGNSVIRWTPFTSKGRGFSTVVNVTYNSLEDHSKSPAGNNVSLSISSLIPFGSQLDPHPNSSDILAGRSAKYVEFTDGDGTLHHFDHVANDVYAEPAGVHLYLRKKNPSGDQTWAITRPDRVTFYFRDDGFPTSVVDKNGNTLTFTLQQTPPGEDPGGPKFRITQVTDAGGRAFTISYYSKNEYKKAHVRGKVAKITNHEGRFVVFKYYRDGNLLRLIQKGGVNADGSFLADRTFVFTYMDSNVDNPAIPIRADRDNPDPNTSPQSTWIFSVRDPRGNETTFRYCTLSGQGNPCGSGNDIPKNKRKLKFRYDRPGESVPGTPRTEVAYDIGPRGTTVKAPLLRETDYAYDTDGKVTSITDPLDRVTSLIWNNDFQVTTLDEPGEPKTTFAYNDNGYLTQRSVLVDREGQTDIWSTTTLEYQNIAADAADVSGNWKQGRTIPHLSQLIKKTDPNGTATQTPTDDYQWAFTYDGSGNLLKVIEPEPANQPDPNQFTTTYAWNANGTLATISDAAGHPATTFNSYDASGLPTQVTDGAGQVTKLGYDSDGQLLWIQDPLHAADTGSKPREYRTYFDYDSFLRLGRQSTPKSTRFDRGAIIWSSTDYDPNDNVVMIMAPHYGKPDDGRNGSKTTIAYDLMDRRTLVTGPDKSFDPAGERTKYDYDDAGRVTKVTLPQGMYTTGQTQDFVVESTYDLLDRVIRQRRYHQKPDSSIENVNTHFCYDSAGDLVRVTAPKAGLDSVNCSQQQPPAYTRTYTYFFDHKLKSQTTPVTTDFPVGTTRSFTYDLNRNLQTLVNENGDTAETRFYDQRNLLARVEQLFDEATSRLVKTAFEYDGVGNRTKLISPRGWDTGGSGSTDYVTTYAYDAVNRLTKVELPKQGSETKKYIHHGYDANGNLTCTSIPVTTGANTCAQLGASSKTVMNHFDPGWINVSDDPTSSPRIRFMYRAEGWQSVRLPVGKPKQQVKWYYFPDGTLSKVVHQKKNLNTYAYDANNNLTAATSQRARRPGLVVTVQATYDWLDRVTKAREKKSSDTNWRATLFTYDLNSNVATREDNRIENNGGGQITAGRISTFVYDEADWLFTQTDDRATPGTCTDDRRITNDWFATGWERTRTISRRADCGNFTLTKQTVDWTWFDNGKVKTVVTKNKDATVVESHTVEYVDNGIYVDGHRTKDIFRLNGPNAKCKTNDCITTYLYDARDRVIQEKKDYVSSVTTTDHTLDNSGNITQVKVNDLVKKTFTYVGDQLQTSVIDGVSRKYWYTAVGDLDCITTNAGSQSNCNPPKGQNPSPNLVADYAYDFLHRLERYKAYSGGQVIDDAAYTNDALDRVDSENEDHPGTANDRITTFTYLGLTNKVTQEKRVKRSDPAYVLSTKTYVYDAYGHRVEMTDVPHPDLGQTRDFTYSYDVHGSTSAIINEATGTVDDSYGYDAYGNKDTDLSAGTDEQDPNASFNPYRYAGKRFDPGSGTYDMGARRFGPDVAHFLQQDLFLGALDDLSLTLDPLTQNRYSLAGGNPIGYVEWDGHVLRVDEDADAGKRAMPRDDQRDVAGNSQPGARKPSPLDFSNVDTIREFQLLSSADRVAWLNWFMDHYSRLGYNIRGWFSAQIGVIEFASDHDLIRKASWFSWVDATILYSIQQGMEIARGRDVGSPIDPAGMNAWATFFRHIKPNPGDVAGLKRLWGAAERASMTVGLGVASGKGVAANPGEIQVLGGALSYQEHLIRGIGPSWADDVAALASGSAWFGGGLAYDPRFDRTAIYLGANFLYVLGCGRSC